MPGSKRTATSSPSSCWPWSASCSSAMASMGSPDEEPQPRRAALLIALAAAQAMATIAGLLALYYLLPLDHEATWAVVTTLVVGLAALVGLVIFHIHWINASPQTGLRASRPLPRTSRCSYCCSPAPISPWNISHPATSASTSPAATCCISPLLPSRPSDSATSPRNRAGPTAGHRPDHRRRAHHRGRDQGHHRRRAVKTTRHRYDRLADSPTG